MKVNSLSQACLSPKARIVQQTAHSLLPGLRGELQGQTADGDPDHPLVERSKIHEFAEQIVIKDLLLVRGPLGLRVLHR